MLPGDIRSKIDALWNAFWTGGISNPLEVIEQIVKTKKTELPFATLQHRTFRGEL